MKPIVEIAKAELKRLFFSPISWLILIIFTFQATILFNGCMATVLHHKSLGFNLMNLTHRFFASDINFSLFIKMHAFLYLYFPLLTMNILSRDFSSGTIKLLYSSPVSNRQIILGKYLSLMSFGAVMIAIIGLLSLYAALHIDKVDWPVVINGLLGLFLLVCAYSAVGLFLSSLTSYAIVAAIATMAALAFIANISTIGQEIPFVRDVTYWFALGDKASPFINGLISTESLLYFLVFVGFFLSLTAVRLRSQRNKKAAAHVLGQYAMVILAASLIGYFSSRPGFKIYRDLTRTQLNTLTKASQDVVKRLNDGLSIKTYVNVLDMRRNQLLHPREYKSNISRYDQYTRFKPEIKFDFIYYYEATSNGVDGQYYAGLSTKQLFDTLKRNNRWRFPIDPYSNIQSKADLSQEDFRSVTVLEKGSGRHAFLRLFDDPAAFPTEPTITAALKRLVDKTPRVGFVTGHGTRSLVSENERGYEVFNTRKGNRVALINNGFDFGEIDLSVPVPDDIAILMIVDCKMPFTDQEMKNFLQYLQRGGNMLIAAEPGKQAAMNPLLETLGVQIENGTLVQPKELVVPEVVLCSPTPQSTDFNAYLQGYYAYPVFKLVMPGATGLQYNSNKGFNVTELFRTDSTSAWNELETTNFIEDTALYNPQSGESKRPFVTALSLARTVKQKKQRIVVTGDADWLSNGIVMGQREGIQGMNFPFFYSVFYHLSGDESPLNLERPLPTDNGSGIEKRTWKIAEPLLKWGLSGLLLAAGLITLIRRKGR